MGSSTQALYQLSHPFPLETVKQIHLVILSLGYCLSPSIAERGGGEGLDWCMIKTGVKFIHSFILSLILSFIHSFIFWLRTY
jgi:hypothetical protein